MKRITIAILSAAIAAGTCFAEVLTEKYAPRLTTPRMYEAFRTTGNIKVDGKLNEGDWTKARESEPFTDIRGAGYPDPVKDTYVKMMWDDTYLYIGARLQEDNIIAKLSQRDTIIYHDNDFEVFIDPDGDAQNYFEFETNAKGVLFDLLLDKPYRSGGSFFIPWNCEGIQLAVSYDGTLNKPTDKDRAWFVEMAIPFESLRRDFTDPKSLTTWRINFSRVQWLVPGQPEENWVWSPTGKVDMHMPERWGFLHFVNAPVGSATANKDYNLDMDAYKLLWTLFYAQQDYQSKNHRYIHRTEDFLLTAKDMALLPAGGEITVDASRSAFDITVSVPSRSEIYSVNQDGKFVINKIAPRTVKNWTWTGLHKDWTPEQYREYFKKIHDAGISAVLFEGYDPEVYKLCKESGLEAHYWKWTMNRRDFMESHPEFYAVNKKGESSYDKPAYVEYYRFLCPSHPEVAEYLAEDYLKEANKPYVDGVHLDYVRFPDVILPVSLWKNYGIEQTSEHPEYDYCYCDLCRAKFKELTGKDPLELQYPMQDQSWVNFRLDAITNVVKKISDKVHADGKFLSGAVFPGPSMAKSMVRQDWGNWSLDAYFPMIYNGFYYEGPEWIGRSVKEGVQALGGRADLYAGMMCPDLKGDDFKKALEAAYTNGASGISFFAGPSDQQLEELKAYMKANNLIPAN